MINSHEMIADTVQYYEWKGKKYDKVVLEVGQSKNGKGAVQFVISPITTAACVEDCLEAGAIRRQKSKPKSSRSSVC